MRKLIKKIVLISLGVLFFTQCLKEEKSGHGGLLIFNEETGQTVDPNTNPAPNPVPNPILNTVPDPGDTVIDTATQVQTGLPSQLLMGKWAIQRIHQGVMSVSPTDTSSRDSVMDVTADNNYFLLKADMTYMTALSPLNVRVQVRRGNPAQEEAIAACATKRDNDSCAYLRNDTIAVNGVCRTGRDSVRVCQRTFNRGDMNQAPYDACNGKAVNDACSYTRGRRETSGLCLPDTAGQVICAQQASPEALAQCAGKAPGAECVIAMGTRQMTGVCQENVIGEIVCQRQRRAPGDRQRGFQKVAATPAVLDSGTWIFAGGLLALCSSRPPNISWNVPDSVRAALAARRDTTLYVPNVAGQAVTFTNTRTRENTRNQVTTKTTTHTIWSGQKVE